MGRTDEFIDANGVKWLPPRRVAEIWNERAEKEYHTKGNYTRWSVYQRKQLRTLATTGGNLYHEGDVYSFKLRPHPKRRRITAPT